MSFYLIILRLFFLFSIARSISIPGYVGVDLSKKMLFSDWQQLLSSTLVTSGVKISFAIILIQFYNGSINYDAVQSIKYAHEAGIKNISLYMYPCIGSSYASGFYHYSCETPQKQFQLIKGVLSSNGIFFRNGSSSISKGNNIIVDKLYIDIEDDIPNRYFSQQHYENFQFIRDFISAAKSFSVYVGFYTTKLDWENVLTDFLHDYNRFQLNSYTFNSQQYFNNYKNQVRIYKFQNGSYLDYNPFSKFPIWLPRFDKQYDFNFFAPFSNWTSVFMKQLSGGSTEERRIGSTRVGMNFIQA